MTSSVVTRAIYSFPDGSAGGSDGLRPQHLKDIITSPYREGSLDLISVLTDFINLVLASKVSPTVRPYFFGASLIGLGKKDGGVRPIVMGGTLHRLVAKCAVLLIKEEIGSLLFPTQLGFGTCRGVEGAVHGAHATIFPIWKMESCF